GPPGVDPSTPQRPLEAAQPSTGWHSGAPVCAPPRPGSGRPVSSLSHGPPVPRRKLLLLAPRVPPAPFLRESGIKPSWSALAISGTAQSDTVYSTAPLTVKGTLITKVSSL